MQDKPHLSPRAITAYNRLCREVAALNYLTRIAKPSGLLGTEGKTILASVLRLANRFYRREAGMPFFACIMADDIITHADLVLIVARLSVAGTEFETRYAHLTAAGRYAYENNKWPQA